MKKLIIVFAIAFTLLTLACSSSPLSRKPDASDARKFFEQQAAFINGNARVKDFRKTNGMDISDREYRLDWEAEVEYLREIRNIVGLAYRKGDIQKLRGSYTFEKTEKGWDFKQE